jgi:hypothetical protein
MGRVRGKLYFEKNKLQTYMQDFVKELQAQGLDEKQIEKRVASHYTNRVIRKYSPEEQDRMWDEIYNIIMNVDGGYWQIVHNMDYMPEFEHYRFKNLKSSMKN